MHSIKVKYTVSNARRTHANFGILHYRDKKKYRLSSVKWCNGDIVTSLQNLCATEINMNSLRFQLALEGFSILW